MQHGAVLGAIQLSSSMSVAGVTKLYSFLPVIDATGNFIFIFITSRNSRDSGPLCPLEVRLGSELMRKVLEMLFLT
jgi:hypothetical protein